MMPTAPPPRPGRVALFALVTVGVLLAGAAVWLFVAARQTTADAERLTEQARQTQRAAGQAADGANRALVDADATREVTGQVRKAIEATFSYDHADLDATAVAADRYLADEARCQYDAIFDQVREQAPAMRLVLRTAVRDVALVRLRDEEAEAIVFFDQSSTRGDKQTTATVAGQLAVRARLEGDSWRLTSFDFFDQPLVGGGAVPKC